MLHYAISWSNAGTFDPVLSGEVTLKLALVLEARASANGQTRSGSGELGAHVLVDTQEQKDTCEVQRRVYDGDLPSYLWTKFWSLCTAVSEASFF